MHSLKRLVTLTTLLVTAACASAPPSPDRAAVAAGVKVRSGMDAGDLAARSGWTLPDGVLLTDGLTRDEAVAIALWNNAEFQAALTELGIARADLVQAGMLRNPVLSLLFPWGPKQFEATATWAVDSLWQRPKRTEDARLNGEAVAHNLIAHGLRLIAEVRVAYAEVHAGDRALALADEQAQLASQLRDLAASRLRRGDISAFEARLTDTDAARLEASRIARRSTRELAIVRLRTLLGMSYDAPPIQLSDQAPPATECGAIPELMKMALASRPDVRGAELQIEAAGARAGLERAKILALTASIDMNGEGKAGFEAGPGLGVELPIFSRNEGGRARAGAEIERATRRYAAVQTVVAQDVQTAFLRAQEAKDATRVLEAGVGASAAVERRQAERLYEGGEISLIELLAIRQRLNDAESTRLEAALAMERATIRLEEAIGRTCGPR